MEFVQGGEIFSRLREFAYFPNDVALFYAVEILLGLEYLHSNSVIYRDLKAENVLIDRTGHVKLVDFSFAKRIMPDEKLRTLCGTADYICPEMLNGKGYSIPVDWWAFGVLIFEFLCGFPPFFERTPMKIYEKILAGKVEIPENLSDSATDLIRSLLNPSPEQRLGSSRDAGEVKDHPWFGGVDFELAFRKAVKPPWVGDFYSVSDSSAFDQFDEMKSIIEPAGASVNQYFRDF